jgi:hypothetical protein
MNLAIRSFKILATPYVLNTSSYPYEYVWT